MASVIFRLNNEMGFLYTKGDSLMSKKAGMILAAAVGTLFAASTFAAANAAPANAATDASMTVKCVGGNACKGTSNCKTATNACKGQNSCKGKGWVMVATEKDCTDKGGKVEAPAADAAAGGAEKAQ